MVNCASASGYAFGFSLLDILLMLSVGLLKKRRRRIQFGQLNCAKKVRSKERTNKEIRAKTVNSATPRTTCARRKRRRNDWKTNQLLTRIQFTILQRERENSSFYGKEKTTHKLYIIPFTQQKVYYYYIVYTCKASRLSLFFFFFFFSVEEERELELGVKLLFVCACFCVDNSDDDFESKGTAAFFFLGASLLNPTP